jgi:murein tripeptide amidase MpaA
MRTVRCLQTSLITLVSGLCVCVSNAQPINLPEFDRIDPLDPLVQSPGEIYQDQTIVRVRTTSQAQLDAVLGLVESVWTERVGVGTITVQISRANLEALTKLGIAHDVLIDDLQAHTDAAWIQLVAQERIDRQKLQNIDQNQRGASVHDEAWFANYKQLSDVITYFNNIATLRPDLASMSTYGTSVLGNTLYDLTISGPDAPGNARADRPVILWNGTQHAREWISPMTVSYLASKFVDSYDTDPRVKNILDSVRIVIAPVANPDGYLYTWSSERFWRKNRRSNGGGSFGVDLNRNWGYEWGGQGASTDPNSDTYRGTSAFSEPETDALGTLAQSFGSDLVAHIDYHSFSQLVLWPFGYADGVQTPEPDRTYFDNLATDLSDEILSFSGEFYNPMQSVDLYPAAGDSSDWFYGALGVKSLTFELRPSSGGLGGFDPPPATILPTAQENFQAAMLFAELTTQRLTFGFTPVAMVEADTATPISITVSDGIASLDPSSPTLYARIGSSGAFSAIAMSDLGNASFGADLPPAPCGDQIEYYFEVSTTDGDTIAYPGGGEAAALSTLAQEFNTAFEDQMESNTGWSVGSPSDSASTGVWNRMDPQGTAAQPENDHTPSGTDCWVTDGLSGNSLGDRDIDGGATTLSSPMLDATSAGEDAELVYWRWYSNNAGASPNEDSMLVQISNNNGSSWTTLETVSENTGVWTEKRFVIADTITPSAQMRVRFVASDLFNGSIVEAGVDDLRIESVGCSTNPADLNGDGNLDFFDVSAFLAAFAAQEPAADFNNDGVWNFFDVSAFLAAFAQG